MQYLGPKTKTEVLKAYYQKLSTSGFASANFVLEEIKANEQAYDDSIKDNTEVPEATSVLEPKIRLLQNETEEIPLTHEQEEHLRKLERMDEAEYNHALDTYQIAETTDLPSELTSFMSEEDAATLASCIKFSRRKSAFLLRGKSGKSMLMMNKYIDDPITDYYIKALDVLVEEKTAKKRTREEMEKPMADEAYRLSRAKVVSPPPDKKNKLTLDEAKQLRAKFQTTLPTQNYN